MWLSTVGPVATLALALLVAPLAADAQPVGKVWRIGVLLASPPAVNEPFFAAFWHKAPGTRLCGGPEHRR